VGYYRQQLLDKRTLNKLQQSRLHLKQNHIQPIHPLNRNNILLRYFLLSLANFLTHPTQKLIVLLRLDLHQDGVVPLAGVEVTGCCEDVLASVILDL